jgi:uncharacterized protein (DUF488 family)
VTVWTVGHSNRSTEDLIDLLAPHGIELLVDVRRFPGSRRHPQFGRDALAGALAEAGIAYRHEEDLGGRRSARPDSPNTAWENAGFRGYADYTATDAFRRALAGLEEEAGRRRTAVMCAEALPWRCHRRLIADALVARGAEVLHVLPSGRAEPHELHPQARLRPDGTLVYPAASEQLGLFEV